MVFQRENMETSKNPKGQIWEAKEVEMTRVGGSIFICISAPINLDFLFSMPINCLPGDNQHYLCLINIPVIVSCTE